MCWSCATLKRGGQEVGAPHPYKDECWGIPFRQGGHTNAVRRSSGPGPGAGIPKHWLSAKILKWRQAKAYRAQKERTYDRETEALNASNS